MSQQPANPLVSVVTPVYNGEKHLAECVKSVLAQTYTHFDYTIIDNHSTDSTLEIAERFAAQDDRIRIINNEHHLDVVASMNKAFISVSPESKYCKLVSADDWVFPRCIEEMVAVAEQNPEVGMVSSYVLSGTRIGWDGLPYPSVSTSGKEICRRRFLDRLKVFGGPSASLIRSDILRSQVPFYNPDNYHGDNEAYLELLKDNDFGFVHQVLSFRRRGEASRTTHYLQRVDSYLVADIEELLHFGGFYLTESEDSELMAQKMKQYHKFLAQALFDFQGKEFWDYHNRKILQLGIPVRYAHVAGYIVLKFIDLMLNPKRTIESAYEKLYRR